MLALRSSTSIPTSSPSSPSSAALPCTPNILPCRIYHNGPTKVTKRYWSPTTTGPDGSTTRVSNFRGRRLRGRRVKIPLGYEGIVAEKTTQTLSRDELKSLGKKYDWRGNPGQDDVDVEEDEGADEGDEELESPTGILDEKARFEEIVVWSHDEIAEKTDAFVKGLEEWVSFAQAMHAPASTDMTSM